MTSRSGIHVPDGPAAGPDGGSRLSRAFRLIDQVNFWLGHAWALSVVVVTATVVYEVVMRSALGMPTIWSNEVTIYLSACAYLVAGGYAMLFRQHVRIDVLYLAVSDRTRRWLDAGTFIFFAAYCLTLIIVGGEMAFTSFQQGETTGTPWNPPIWPVKAMIPISGILLLLQGIANQVRDFGIGVGSEEAK